EQRVLKGERVSRGDLRRRHAGDLDADVVRVAAGRLEDERLFDRENVVRGVGIPWNLDSALEDIAAGKHRAGSRQLAREHEVGSGKVDVELGQGREGAGELQEKADLGFPGVASEVAQRVVDLERA